MKRQRSKPKKPRKFKHGKPAAMGFGALRTLQASKAPPREYPALEAFLYTDIGQVLGHLFLALVDPTTADDLAKRDERDDSKDDDRIVVRQA